MKAKLSVVLSISLLVMALAASPVLAAPAAVTSTGTGIVSSSTGPAPIIKGPVFIDYAKSQIRRSTSNPSLFYVILVGSLPSPCHKLVVSVSPADSKNTIRITAFSEIQAGTTCAAVATPFKTSVSLGSFKTGSFTVLVNGVKLGSFTAEPVSVTSSNK
jgi:hypothetical protein